MEIMARRKKSVGLSKDEMNVLRQYRRQFLAELDCAEAIGIGRGPLNRIMLVGSGSPVSIDKIKLAIGNFQRERDASGLKGAQ